MDWIPVSEREPPVYERVLVYDATTPAFPRHKSRIVIGYRTDHHPFFRWSVPDGTEPTHWMPLPDYPADSNGA